MPRGRPSGPKLFAGDPATAGTNVPAVEPLPTCPSDLDAATKKKWRELVKLLAETGMLRKVDRDVLALYCTAYSRWREAEKFVAKLGHLIKGSNGGFYLNPSLAVANRAMEQMRKFGKLLGLDPASRKALGMKATPKVNGVQARDRSKGPPPPKPRDEIA